MSGKFLFLVLFVANLTSSIWFSFTFCNWESESISSLYPIASWFFSVLFVVYYIVEHWEN